jgi:PIN domain nuclease of toxin-antitoxin system
MTRGVLLDTHVLIAHVNNKDIFGRATKHLLRTPHPFFSPLSIAEMRLKESVKKQKYLAEDITPGLRQLGYRELPLVSKAAEGITGFPPLHHHDPFDRLLLAQAKHHNLLFITADQILLRLDLEFVHDAYA